MVDLISTWPLEEQTYHYSILGMQNNSTNVETRNPQSQKYRSSNEGKLNPPSKEELLRLRDVLGIEKGSLQFKRRGLGIYHVVYSEGRHRWDHLGSWKELKEKLDIESAVE